MTIKHSVEETANKRISIYNITEDKDIKAHQRILISKISYKY